MSAGVSCTKRYVKRPPATVSEKISKFESITKDAGSLACDVCVLKRTSHMLQFDRGGDVVVV